MKKFAAFLLCALMVLTMAAPAIAAVPDADAKLIESLGKKASDYVALDWFAEMNAYYNSGSATQGNVVISKANSTATNLANFIVSKTFTQKELPIGSIIIVDAGFQYRPEGWVKADLSADDVARPGNVTTNVVEVTKEWWGTFTVRAFNLSTTPTRAVVEGDKAALRIYVPKPAEETTKAPAATTKAPAATPAAPATFDAGIIVAAVAAVSLAGTVVLKKKR